MTTVTISPRGLAIVEACETKVRLQNRAEELSAQARELIAQLKLISDEQYGLLQNINDLDRKIHHLAKSC